MGKEAPFCEQLVTETSGTGPISMGRQLYIVIDDDDGSGGETNNNSNNNNILSLLTPK